MRIETPKTVKMLTGRTSRKEQFEAVTSIDEVLTKRTGSIGETVLPAKSLENIEDIKAESVFLSESLKKPVDPGTTDQDELYSILEKRITRLGLAMGEEAERRAGFDKKEFEEAISTSSKEYLEAKRTDEKLMEACKQASVNYLRAKKAAGNRVFPGKARELERLKALKEELEEKGYEAHLEVECLQREEDYRVAMLRMETKRKLAYGYSSVISDIRPVGGMIPNHEYTDRDTLEILNRTVGRYYPSDWIKASEVASEMAVAPTGHNRAKYSAHEFYPSKPEQGLEVQESFAGLVSVEKAMEFIEKISKEGIEIHGYGTSFDNGDGEYQVVEFAYRQEFNPERDEMDENGIPVGLGWHFGYVPRTAPGGLHVPEEKVWYRIPVNYGRVVPTLFMAHESAGYGKQTATAYHEFAHRVEDVVRDGVIEYLEEAFLVRRTTDENGEREELSAMKPGDGTFSGTELGRKGTFMMHYIGKEYLTHRSREVLSVGAESLFAGSYGSFLGIDGIHPADLDHRGFTLGIFAVV